MASKGCAGAVRLLDLIIDQDREDHIARHHVRVFEVEEVAFGDPLITRTREERYRLIG